MSGRIFISPSMNTYGPATDPKHADLLNDWPTVHKGLAKYFTPSFRNTLVDDAGEGAKISWFINSWSGFESNPVHRDFGWFNIHDQIIGTWGQEIKKQKDGIFWIYNHPDETRIGNKWGLDWFHNTHYLQILARMVLEKEYFPKFVQVPTADTQSTNFLENYFPFELSNRHSKLLNWENIEADGRMTKDILKWDKAPDSWIPYRPDFNDHQLPGHMKHRMFRILDIKTRIITFPESEILKAFEEANAGNDCVITGYEHDFRDRSEAVQDIFLAPINKMRAKYPKVKVFNTNMFDAALKMYKTTEHSRFDFDVESKCDHIQISSTAPLFNHSPFVAVKFQDKYLHINPTYIGQNTWAIEKSLLPERFQLGVASFSSDYDLVVKNFIINNSGVSKFKPMHTFGF